MKYFIAALFCSAIVFYGCTKAKNDSAKSILTSHNWYLVKDLQDTTGVSDTINRQIPVCASDDYITFDNAGGALVHSGEVKCDTSEKDTYTMNYDATSKVINMYNFDGIPGNNYVWNVVTLNNTVLEVTYLGNEAKRIFYHRTYIAK